MVSTRTTWVQVDPTTYHVNTSDGLDIGIKCFNNFRPGEEIPRAVKLGGLVYRRKYIASPAPGTYTLLVHPIYISETQSVTVIITHDEPDLPEVKSIPFYFNPDGVPVCTGFYDVSVWILIFLSTMFTIFGTLLYWKNRHLVNHGRRKAPHFIVVPETEYIIVEQETETVGIVRPD